MYIYAVYVAETTVDSSAGRRVAGWRVRGGKVIDELSRMRPRLRVLVLTAMLIAAPEFSFAADADAGAVTAEPCLSCHFSDDFVGESEADILSLIEDALADSMHPPDDGVLSESDLEDIAAFFARGE